MPIYEYGCKACGHKLDALQKINDAPLVVCPECDAASLKRLISAPRFRLKGSGWYETDFKSDNQRNLAKSDSDGGSKSDAKNGEGKAGGSKKSENSGKSDSGGSTGSAGRAAEKSSAGKSASAD